MDITVDCEICTFAPLNATVECTNDRCVAFFSLCCIVHYKFVHRWACFAQFICTAYFFILSEIDHNQYNYQCYYSYLQNQSLPTSENSQNPPQYVMCPPPLPTSENSQNSSKYVMYPPPPHMWYMHPSSNIEAPTSGSSQNPQIYSQPSTPTNSNTCYRPSLSNIAPLAMKLNLHWCRQYSTRRRRSKFRWKKSRIAFSLTEDVILVRSWLNASMDSIIRVDLTSKQY